MSDLPRLEDLRVPHEDAQGASSMPNVPNLGTVLLRRKGIVFMFAILGLTLGVLYYVYKTPVYESYAQILVNEATPVGIDNDPLNLNHNLGQILETQALLIGSPAVVGPAIHDRLSPTELSEEEEADLETKELLKKVDAATDLELPDEEEPSTTEDETPHRSESALFDGLSVATVIRNLSVEQEKDSAILTLGYSSHKQSECEKVLSEIIKSYERHLTGARGNLRTDAIALIVRAKNELEEEIAKREAEFLDFKKRNAHLLLTVNGEHNIHQARQADLETERRQILVDRAQIEGQLASIDAAIKNGVDHSALLLMMKGENLLTEHPVARELESIESRILQIEADRSQADRKFDRIEDRMDLIDERSRDAKDVQANLLKAEALVKRIEESLRHTQGRLESIVRLERELNDPQKDDLNTDHELLLLLQQEKQLMERFGSDHPDVVSVRSLIELTRKISQTNKLKQRREELRRKREETEDEAVSLQGELVVANVDQASLRKQLETLQHELAEQAAQREVLAGQLALIEQEQNQLRQERDTLKAQFDELKLRRYDLEPYVESLNQKLSTLQQRKSQLDAMFDLEQEESKTIQGIEAEAIALESSLNRIRRLYDQVIKRLAEIEIADDIGGYNIQVIAQATPGKQVDPLLAKSLAIFGFLSLTLGMGLAYVCELADKRFRSPEEIRNDLGYRLLGHIPMLPLHRSRDEDDDGLDASILVHHQPMSIVSECYRSIRTGLYFSTGNSNQKLLQVTSPFPGDGKSTLAANLAVSIAQSGKRVVLIDADLRRPKVHKLFGMEEEPGLSSVIAGDLTIEEALQFPDVANLSVISAGERPENPAELLSSIRFQQVLDALRNEADFDYVVVDTPPLLAVTDASNVAPQVDGVLLVLRLTKKTRAAAHRATEILADLDAPVLGVVVNGVNGRDGYGYEYGNAFGSYATPVYGYVGYGEARNGSENVDPARKRNGRSRVKTEKIITHASDN